MAAEGRRLVLLSARAETAYHHFTFRAGDMLAVGSESRGAPRALVAHVAAAVRIPLCPGLRSLNVVTAAAIGLAEALRQLDALPAPQLRQAVEAVETNVRQKSGRAGLMTGRLD
jgi:tRNA (cytidine/uridine-2'-O-)-methyltransferase